MGLTNYPLDMATYKAICLRRGLDYLQEVSQELFETKEYQLSEADVYSHVCSMVDLSDPDQKVTMPFVTSIYILMNKANAIYSKYNEPLLSIERKTKSDSIVTYISI